MALLDPPWENKHVRRERRRGRGYETVEAFHDFSGLVVALAEKLEERGLVVLWCTPSERARRAAENMLEEAGLQVVARYFFLCSTTILCGVHLFSRILPQVAVAKSDAVWRARRPSRPPSQSPLRIRLRRAEKRTLRR